MQHEDNVVQTSDCDEREEEESKTSQYWTRGVASLRAARPSSWGPQDAGPSGAFVDELPKSPRGPRKRVKRHHRPSSDSPRSISRDGATPHTSPRSSSLVLTPSSGQMWPHQGAQSNVPENSQDPLLLSRDIRSLKQPDFMKEFEENQPDVHGPLFSTSSAPLSRSPSVDPLSLLDSLTPVSRGSSPPRSFSESHATGASEREEPHRGSDTPSGMGRTRQRRRSNMAAAVHPPSPANASFHVTADDFMTELDMSMDFPQAVLASELPSTPRRTGVDTSPPHTARRDGAYSPPPTSHAAETSSPYQVARSLFSVEPDTSTFQGHSPSATQFHNEARPGAEVSQLLHANDSPGPFSLSPLSMAMTSPVQADKARTRATSSPRAEASPVAALRSRRDAAFDIEDASASLAADLAEVQEARYPLRQRQARQVNPYQFDKLFYKRQMRSNPDAIVKFVSPTRQAQARETYPDNEEQTQDAGWAPLDEDPDDDEWQERERRHHHRRRSSLEPLDVDGDEYPDFLRHAVSSDEEEIDHVRKEAREARRKMKAKEAEEKRRERELEAARKRHRQDAKERRRLDRDLAKQSIALAARRSKNGRRSISHDSSKRAGGQPSSPSAEPDVNDQGTDRFQGHLDSPSQPIEHAASGFEHEDLDMGDRLGGSWSGWERRTSDSETRVEALVDCGPGSPGSLGQRSEEEGSDPTSADGQSNPDSSSDEELTAKDLQRLKILKRMMPTSMAMKMLYEEKGRPCPQPKRRILPARASPSHSSESDEVGTRPFGEDHGNEWASMHTIDGGEHSNETDSVHPRHVVSGPVEVVEISSDSASDPGDIIDDSDIDSWFDDARGRRAQRQTSLGPPRKKPRLRQGNLVDYMLSRSRTVGKAKQPSKGRRETQKHSGPSKKRKPIHIITAGVRDLGAERQTMLSLRPSPSHRSGSGRPMKRVSSKPAGHHRPPSLSDGEEGGYLNDGELRHGHNVAAKTGMRQRHKRPVYPDGVYLFDHAPGTRITSGARKGQPFSVQIEAVDDEWYSALEPEVHVERHLPKYAMDLPLVQEGSDHVHRCHPSVPLDHERNDDIKTDCDLPSLPDGTYFGSNTYIGRGWLKELTHIVSSQTSPAQPLPFSHMEISLGSPMSLLDFRTTLTVICDKLVDLHTNPSQTETTEEQLHWLGLMHATCQWISWLPTVFTFEECLSLQTAVREQCSALVSRLEDWVDGPRHNSRLIDPLMLSTYWFATEASARIDQGVKETGAEIDGSNLTVKLSFLTMKRLQQLGLRATVEGVSAGEDAIQSKCVSQRAAEIWICFVHFMGSCQFTSEASVDIHSHPLWALVLQLFQSRSAERRGVVASEDIWLTIFSLATLSRFTVHGRYTTAAHLPAAWELVAFALRQIRLKAEEGTGERLSGLLLDKRDAYVGLVMSRCFLLRDRYHWPLDNAIPMFDALIEVFKSRNFGNLRGEPSDFPNFMLEHDIELVSRLRPNDTAFELLMKLLMQAGLSDDQAGETADSKPVAKLRKLVSLFIPLGSLRFTKDEPPTEAELARLYNRLAAVAVSIYLDSALTNIKHKMAIARSYIDLGVANMTTRVACIRGMMHSAILLQHREKPMDEALKWVTTMAQVLVTEYRTLVQAHKDKRPPRPPSELRQVILTAQLLLGSVRQVIETPCMHPGKRRTAYPDPALLEGPWVVEFFALSELVDDKQTGLEMRRLVKSFLDAREILIPRPARPRIQVPATEESQESQDEYGHLDLDLNDPLLIAALDDHASMPVDEDRRLDARVATVLDKHVIRAIHHWVCKHAYDEQAPASAYETCDEMDSWIDNWVACASVLVQNGVRTWEHFIGVGPKTWKQTIDTLWRLRIGLRFMLMLLRHDPPAYLADQDQFIDVLLSSLATAQVTIEHEYFTEMVNLGALRHPLLLGYQLPSGADDYDAVVSRAEFLTIRGDVVQTVFRNLNDCLKRQRDTDSSSVARMNQIHLGFLVNLFAAMEAIYGRLEIGSAKRTAYGKFCLGIWEALGLSDDLRIQPRLQKYVAWCRSLPEVA